MVTSILPLKIDGAIIKKKGTRLIGPIDLDVSNTGITTVIGPNGSGKTTLLRMMHGLERPRSGILIWNCVKDVFNRQSFVFQTPIMMHRSVEENIAYPLVIRGASRANAMKTSIAAIEAAGLSFALGRRATSLSGGEKQKLAIVRALITDPEILFLDEPTTNLDGHSVRDIESTLRDAAANGTRIMMATHDLHQAKRLADDVVFVYRGMVHETASKDVFMENQKTNEAKAFMRGDIVL